MGIMEVISQHSDHIRVCRVALLTREAGDVSAELADAMAQSRQNLSGRSTRMRLQSNGCGRGSATQGDGRVGWQQGTESLRENVYRNPMMTP